MRQPVLKLVVASFAKPVDALCGAVGSSVGLRADWVQDAPLSATTRFEWIARPRRCVEWGEKRLVPDFKREAILRGKGTLRVVAFDEHGFSVSSQTVKVRPSVGEGGA